MDWSETLAWLRDHPDAEPGGDADLFDMPLPAGIEVAGEEWTGSPFWGEQGKGITGTEWRIGTTGYSVIPELGLILDPEGTYIR